MAPHKPLVCPTSWLEKKCVALKKELTYDKPAIGLTENVSCLKND